jgi:protein SCO1
MTDTASSSTPGITRLPAWWLGASIAALALAIAAQLHGRMARTDPAPPVFGPAPDFALIDQRGRDMTGSDLRGSVWIADFIFTRCAGQCPVMTGRMAELAGTLPAASGVQFVSFTVDPEYDTPERLAAYARGAGVPPERWRLLTGPVATIERLARDGFKLGMSADGTAEEPITHSVRFVLIDPEGRIRGYYDAQDAGAVDRLRRDALRLAGRQGA